MSGRPVRASPRTFRPCLGMCLPGRTARMSSRACCAVHTAPAPQVTPSAAFQKDLGLDSLDTVELVMALEEEFAVEIPDNEADKILSTADAIAYIASNPMAR